MPVEVEEFDQSEPLSLRNAIQDEFRTHPQPWFDWVRSRLDLQPGSLVLELGSGLGELWQDDFGQQGQVVLSDVSAGMLVDAHQRLAQAGFPASYALLDGEAIPFPPGQFDWVLAIGVFDLVPDLPAALREVQRVLKPGGWLACSAGGQSHLQEFDRLVKLFLEGANLGGEPEQFGIENAASQLEPLFRPILRSLYQDELVFDQAGPVVEYILSEKHIQSQLTGELRERFVALVRGYLNRNKQLRVRRQKALFLAKK